VTKRTRQHERGVLDTSTLILLPRLEDPALLPAEPLITAVTLAELSVGPLVASTDAERAARQAHLQQAEADFDPLPFDARAARSFGRSNPTDFAGIAGLEVVAVPVPERRADKTKR